MKMNNKKHVSLIVVLAMLIAYVIPTQFGVFAANNIVWTFENPTNDAVTSSNGKLWYTANVALGNGLTAYNNGGTIENAKQGYDDSFEIDTKSKTEFTVNGKAEEVVGALKFGGKSKSNARYLTFTPSAGGTVTAYVKHGSPSKDNTNIRTLTMTQGSKSKNIATIGTDAPNLADSFDVEANIEIKITCDDNVALAKLVFSPAGSVDPEETAEPTTGPTDMPQDTEEPTSEPSEAPSNTEKPAETQPVQTNTPAPTQTAAPAQTATPVPTQAATNPPKATSTPDADLSPDEQAVRADAEALKINSISQTAVYFDLDLDKQGANGSTITWESSDSKYIDIQMVSSIKRNYTGVVTRPKEEECDENGGVPVTLTATLKKGSTEYKKVFEVSVRKWNPNVYYNDFEQDLGKSAEGSYGEIADNVAAANGKDTFRGIRVDTLNESRCFDAFEHGDPDRPSYFDKRVMSLEGTPYNRPSESGNSENFAFYYSEYKSYGGSSTIPMWIRLTEPETGAAPEGIVLMTMDIYVIDGQNRINLGFANSKPSQMCRFLLGSGSSSGLGYSGSGYIRCFSNENSMDFMGGTKGYRHPLGKWVKAIMVANSDSHKWDFYYDGMLVGEGYDFRNAEDMVSTIEFTMDRNTSGGAYLIDNIYVENMTEDYRNRYWEEVEITSIPYDAAADAYVADAPFLLQYQGTEGLSGNTFTWQSSNTKVLSVASKRVNIEDLINFGYTEEQISEYKSQGIKDATVMIATPGDVAEDTYVTLTAKLAVGGSVNRKEFKVLVKKSGSSVSGDDAKALEDANAISSVSNGMTVTSDIDLAATGKINGSKITWRSSHANIISSSGVVTRPSNNAVNVTLTAIVQYGEAIQYKTFTVTVSPKSTSGSTTGGGGGGGGGGGIRPSKSNGIASAPIDSTPGTNDTVNNTNNNVVRPVGSPSFDDLDKASWAKDAIEYLYSKDIVNGYGNGLYGVNDDVTREQFIRMLLTTLNIKLVVDENTTFSDVLPDTWYTNYVNAALNMGIVNGISSDSFGVGQPISRQDMAVMCMRAFEYISETPQEKLTAEPEVTAAPEATEDPEAAAEPEMTAEPETTAEPKVSEEPETTDIPEATEEPADEETELSPIDNVPVFDVADSEVSSILTFGDADEISDYAMKAVAMMTKAGYLKGNDMGYFMPKKSLTRAETAMLLYRIITQEDL